ncbi:MAG: bifunctional serine/threonine-protein kinase/formylglycine-generating enzyme family protein, partial [Planctomycetota bacterium]
ERLAQRHPRLEDELRSLHAEFENLERVLDEAAASPEFPLEELSRLHARGGHRRYRIEGEIARGGQGAVMRIWDSDLKRHLAMKLTLGRVTSSSAGDGDSPTPASSTPPLDSRTIHRFLNEAKITGQLDHPGIVPIHELGVDDDGQAYFTMKLVNGHSLHEIFHRHRQGDPEWPTQRCVGLILKATEAVAYAHSKGIIHRDLKPANIMVGEYGEVYVMDWGMARDLGREPDPREPDAETQPAGEPSLQALVTQEGGVFGTPAYMPPEQARGEISKLDERSDVYALGAVLYELQTGHAPYKDLVEDAAGAGLLELVWSRPPSPIDALADSAHPELVAIANKAMQRRLGARYAAATELLKDLRAHSEGRVVQAFEYGMVAELRKWVHRNRALASTLAAAVALLTLGAIGVLRSEYLRAQSDRARLREAELATIEDELLLTYSGLLHPLAPGHPVDEDWRMWAQRARRLEERMERMRVDLGYPAWDRVLQEAFDSADPDDPLVVKSRMQATYVDAIRGFPLKDRDEFTADEASTYRAALDAFEVSSQTYKCSAVIDAALLRLDRKAVGGDQRREYLVRGWAGMSGLPVGGVGELLQRIEAMDSAGDVQSAASGVSWEECVADIANASESPRYGGLELRPSMGVFPLGKNANTGLWEFWVPGTGELPLPDPTGGWAVDERSAIVLVLIPGGDVSLGVQNTDPTQPRFEEWAEEWERPVRKFPRLDPFYFSKFELTQGQWLRVTGTQPCWKPAGSDERGFPVVTLAHPVESVTWDEARIALSRVGLQHPTEAQWSLASGEQSGLRYGASDDPAWAESHSNYADLSRVTEGSQPEVMPNVNDGYSKHRPVGFGLPNVYGVHDCLGNVREWCGDWYSEGFSEEKLISIEPGSGAKEPEYLAFMVVRGGSFRYGIAEHRLSKRFQLPPSLADPDLGVRPSLSAQLR